MVDYYVIYVERIVDGDKVHQVYQGESGIVEDNPASTGFGHHYGALAYANGIKFGRAFDDGHKIGGFTNLKSHIDKILNRAKRGDLGTITELYIKRIDK